MWQVVRRWFDRYFSDEQAVYLFLVLLTGLLLVVFFGRALAPVLTAIIIAYLLQGMVSALRRRGVAEQLSVFIVYFLFLTLLVMSLVIMLPLLWKQSVHLVQEQLPRLLANTETWLRALPERYPQMISGEQVDQVIVVAREEITAMGQAILSVSLASIPGLLDAMIFLVLLPLLVFFFLKDRKLLTGWAMGWLPSQRGALASVWKEMDLQIANYVRGKAVEIIIVTVASLLLFYGLGLNYAFLLAILVGLSVVVPYIGATVVTLPLAAVGWIQFGWTSDFALLMLLYAVIQFLDGNLLVPILFSEAVNLHPVAIITAILFFGSIWGLWGVFFAIPLATLIKAVLDVWPRQQEAPPGPAPA